MLNKFGTRLHVVLLTLALAVAVASSSGCVDSDTTSNNANQSNNGGTGNNGGSNNNGSGELGSPSGDLELKEAPLSVVPNETESDKILVFRERGSYALPADLTVEASAPGMYESTADLVSETIAQGTSVDSYYVHFDHPGGGRVEKSGSITFSQPILGVIATSDGMVAANTVIKVEELTTIYPTSEGSLFGFELDSEPDVFELGSDGKTLSIDVSTGSKCDSIRVVTQPAP